VLPVSARSAPVDIAFFRPHERASYAVVTRADGVTVRVPGYGSPLPLPHDIVHCIVERALRLNDGFWGCVVAGALFPNMRVLAGRRRPHAAERSETILRACSPAITRAEVVVAGFLRVMEQHLEGRPDSAIAVINERQSVATDGPIAIDRETLARVMAVLRDVEARWVGAGVGGTLTLRWDVPPVEVPLRRERARVKVLRR
jgi:hypothetical protein